LEVGEITNDGDLHWHATVKHWVAVAPQGEERVAPRATPPLQPQERRLADLQFNDLAI
jgi:hypothetical protein